MKPALPKIEIYTKQWCTWCLKATALLVSRRIPFVEVSLTHDKDREAEMRSRSGRSGVPQIFIDGKPIGGYEELARMEADGRLQQLFGTRPGDTVRKPVLRRFPRIRRRNVGDGTPDPGSSGNKACAVVD